MFNLWFDKYNNDTACLKEDIDDGEEKFLSIIFLYTHPHLEEIKSKISDLRGNNVELAEVLLSK